VDAEELAELEAEYMAAVAVWHAAMERARESGWRVLPLNHPDYAPSTTEQNAALKASEDAYRDLRQKADAFWAAFHGRA
jgi:hypothetical protein